MDLFNTCNKKEKAVLEVMTREEMCNAFILTLKDASLSQFVNIITSRFNEVLEYADFLNGKNTCQKTSLLFNPHRLNTKTISSKQSVFEALRNDKFLSGLARAILYKRSPKGIKYKDMLYQTLSMNISGVQYVNEFPPKKAADLYESYNLNEDSNILDPCAGWGGRMIGASKIKCNYVGYEPSVKTYKGLILLSEYIRSMNKSFSSKIYCLPFEESKTEINKFDFAFTSPPYYDTEIYSDENTNSLNKFKTFEDWCSGFYIPMIKKTMDSLKNGCTFVLNIGSRRYPLNQVLIDNFSDKYEIKIGKEKLQGKSGLKVSNKEGETFYHITKY